MRREVYQKNLTARRGDLEKRILIYFLRKAEIKQNPFVGKFKKIVDIGDNVWYSNKVPYGAGLSLGELALVILMRHKRGDSGDCRHSGISREAVWRERLPCLVTSEEYVRHCAREPLRENSGGGFVYAQCAIGRLRRVLLYIAMSGNTGRNFASGLISERE